MHEDDYTNADTNILYAGQLTDSYLSTTYYLLAPSHSHSPKLDHKSAISDYTYLIKQKNIKSTVRATCYTFRANHKIKTNDHQGAIKDATKAIKIKNIPDKFILSALKERDTAYFS